MSLQIRAAVARATRTVVPLWPLSSFIAVNPLGGHEHEQFDAVAPTRSREAFLEDYAHGHIVEGDLIAAAFERAPELAAASDIRIDGREWSAGELVARELVHTGPPFGATPSPVADEVDELLSKWVAAYLDPHPLWQMPNRERGLWGAWRAMARFDSQLPMKARRRLRNLPERADDALQAALDHWGVDTAAIEGVLREEAQRSPGWTGHIKWRADRRGDVDLTSYLAVRVTLRWALGLAAPRPTSESTRVSDSLVERTDRLIATLLDGGARSDAADSAAADFPAADFPAADFPAVRARVARILALHPQDSHAGTWQNAYELHYRHRLLGSLGDAATKATHTGASPATPPATPPAVQVVMCIDPRSEGMRRHLELDPAIETFGFAGFFGVPLRFATHEARGTVDALPALLSARHLVTERAAEPRRAARHTRALRARAAVNAALHATESTPAAPFALAETLGWFSGAATLLRTLAPAMTARSVERVHSATTPTLDTEVTIADAFTLEERAGLAENSIRMMGLRTLADLVILAGHESTSANNLYESALDCGACGGNPGRANARAAAAIFNDPDVRRVLDLRGLPIPASTVFVAAEHNTVTDRVEILDHHLIPRSHAAAVAGFQTAQDAAADALVLERSAQLPGALGHGVARMRRRAHDWAEVYPELGLAGNAAMIIGPRELSRGVDLDRRVFLHSYLTDLDPEGAALETIMTAPLVVAQWINHQYYFSAVDNDRWGAGTKTIHNAVGTLGVLSGQTGDLRVGLPLQSVAVGRRLLHEPRRLSVVIQAPLPLIGAVVSRNQVLRNLFDNNWITLTARDDEHSPWLRYGPYGWTTLTTPAPTPTPTPTPSQGD